MWCKHTIYIFFFIIKLKIEFNIQISIRRILKYFKPFIMNEMIHCFYITTKSKVLYIYMHILTIYIIYIIIFNNL